MHVFISYARQDREFTRKIVEQLRGAGLSVWMDEEELVEGDNWALETGKALEGADAMVAVISPASMASDAVLRDIDYALGSPRFQGRLIAVQAEPTKHFPWILKKLVFIDATRHPVEDAARQITHALMQPVDVADH